MRIDWEVGYRVRSVSEDWGHDCFDSEGNRIWTKIHGIIYPSLDEIYTIRDILCDNNLLSIRLEEIVNPLMDFMGQPSEASWRIFKKEGELPLNFELVTPRRYDISVFTRLLTPRPELVT